MEPAPGVVLGCVPVTVGVEGLDRFLEEAGEAVEPVRLLGGQPTGLAAAGERPGGGTGGASKVDGREAEAVGEAVGRGG